MDRSQLIKALAKVIIAAAWTDGSVSNDEINSLKDLLFQMPGMTARDWAELEIYLDAPVGPEERDRLVSDLQAALTSRQDRELAVRTLEVMIQADGAISEQEQAVFEEIKQALDDVNINIFGQVRRLVSAPVERRTETAAQGRNRELFLDDFVHNRIYYRLRQRMGESGQVLNLPEPTLRKLSLAGGLLARIAYVDREVSEGEFDRMAVVIQDVFLLEREQAGFVAEIAISAISQDLDYYRLSREFFEATTEEERIRFLDVLFAVAAADGIVSHAEMEEIRTVAIVLKLGHQPFIDAKLKIPRAQRAY